MRPRPRLNSARLRLAGLTLAGLCLAPILAGCVELSRTEKLTTHRTGMTGRHMTPGKPGSTMRVLPSGTSSRLVPPDLPGVWSHDAATVKAAKEGNGLPPTRP